MTIGHSCTPPFAVKGIQLLSPASGDAQLLELHQLFYGLLSMLADRLVCLFAPPLQMSCPISVPSAWGCSEVNSCWYCTRSFFPYCTPQFLSDTGHQAVQISSSDLEMLVEQISKKIVHLLIKAPN